jgi:hypothetical protein
VTGTNDIENDDCTDIIAGYRMLLDRAKKVGSRKVTVVGIMNRFDVTRKVERKRWLVNMKLRELCEEKGVEFVKFELLPSMVISDGVHLNLKGNEFVGRKLMKHCLHFLE